MTRILPGPGLIVALAPCRGTDGRMIRTRTTEARHFGPSFFEVQHPITGRWYVERVLPPVRRLHDRSPAGTPDKTE